MPSFNYKARSRDGSKKSGTIEAPDRHAAISMLSRQGLVPVTLTQGEDKKSRSSSGGMKLVLSNRKKLTTRQVLSFTTELSDLLSSGMTLGNALNCLSSREDQGIREQIISDLRDEIVQGRSLSDALSKYPDTFGNLYVNMVRAGEASGAVDDVLCRLVEHYERSMDLHERVVAALVYPLIVMVMGAGVLVFTMLYVLPKFESFFTSMGESLPTSTKILMNCSEWMVKYGVFLLIGIIFAIIAFKERARCPNNLDKP